MITLDKTTISKITSQSEMDEFVNSLNFKSDTVIVKPNWVEAAAGTHTEAKVLDLFFGSLKNKKIYLIESYTFWRHQQYFEKQQDAFSSKEAQFETGIAHWDFYKQADEWFLQHTGIGEVLKKHNATYINVTNELWANRQSPIELIPQAIYDLKGSDFISFAKLKGDADYGATLSIKNLFGLYPDPTRLAKYHADSETHLAHHIIHINKIYKELFNCHFVVEGIYTATSFDWANKENTKTFFDQQVIIGGPDAIQVDDTALKVIGRQLKGPLSNLLTDYQSQIGGNLQTQQIPNEFKINFPKL
jgi:hypothetical protein